MARILLLEPDAVLGNTYKAALKTAGHDVAWRRTAQGAINEIDKQAADVIITELQLALHNGIEFLYELRSYREWVDTPVIVLSNVLPQQTAIGKTLWEHIKIKDYHYKPTTKLSALINTVEKALTPQAAA